MQTELYSLSKIFMENLFRIPDYQRGYSWGAAQLKHFWTDIILLSPGRDHYTGVLTLEDVEEGIYHKWSDDLWIITSKRYRPYYVVDGQQRLTTSLILLQCILEKVDDGTELNYYTTDEIRKKYIFASPDKGISRSHIFGYEKDNPSDAYLKTKIFMESTDLHTTGEETIYTQNLIAAKMFFKEKLAELSLEELEQIFTKLTQRFLFNIYVISKDIDVFVAFETMNNRGKPLSYLELLKNRLIFLSTRLDVDDYERNKLRKVINESWKTAYHYLGRNPEKPLNDDNFLDVQFILYVGTQPSVDTLPEKPRSLWRHRHHDDHFRTFLLEKYFTTRNITNLEGIHDANNLSLTAESLYQYAHDLKRCVETYYKLFNPIDSEFCDDIRIHLARIGRLGWRDGLPLVIASVHRCPKEADLARLLRNLERYLFVQSIRFYYDDEELDLISLSIDILKGNETVNTVADKIHTVTDKRVAKLDFTDTAVSLAKTRAYYGWRALNYFLFEYEQELKKRSRADRDKIVWKEFCRENFEEDYNTIEHIYPQKPRDQYWKDKFGHKSVKERNALRNSVGNLLALSRPKNAFLSNRPFPEKRNGTAESGGYKYGSYSEIEVSNIEDWTPETVLERGVRLLDFLEKRWQIPIGDRRKKIAALGLKFMDYTDGGSTD